MANRTPTADDDTQPTNVPDTDGDGVPALSLPAGARTDPTPAAATPVASAESQPRDGDGAAGAGRPIRDGKGQFVSPVPTRRIPAELFAAEADAILGMTAIEADGIIPPLSAAFLAALDDADEEIARVRNTHRFQDAAVRMAPITYVSRNKDWGGAA